MLTDRMNFDAFVQRISRSNVLSSCFHGSLFCCWHLTQPTFMRPKIHGEIPRL